MSKECYYNIEVGLSGTGEATSSWKQSVFLGHEAVAIVRRIWLGILANKDEASYIKLKGAGGVLLLSCTATSNPDIDDLELPSPFTE